MINNLILLATAGVTAIGTMFVIMMIDSTFGLHQLFFVGDVELVVVALVTALMLTAISTRWLQKRPAGMSVTSTHFKDCALLYLIVILLIPALISSSSDLRTAYLVVVTLSGVAVILSHFLLSFLRYRSGLRV